jgi:L-ascorbate metabolism protein UlaG (beta-lactamase superfamily)
MVSTEPSDHFDGRRFFNPGGPKPRGLGGVLRWKLSTRPARWPVWVDDVQPAHPPKFAQDNEWRVTFVNHATVLLQFPGCNILTDPVWAERASPVSWAGPKRHRAPGVRLADLPPIDIVLLSHNHYDHCDLKTIRFLVREHRPLFITTLGLAKLLQKTGADQIRELDWWNSTRWKHLTVHCVPAQHFSARSAWDRNKTLWCGFVIEIANQRLYFAGDSGYGAHFRQIQQRLGNVRAALLPIGAYRPIWFMSPVHMTPAEAVKAYQDVRAELAVPIHYGTFQLTDEPIDEPVEELRKAIDRAEAKILFKDLRNGEELVIPI